MTHKLKQDILDVFLLEATRSEVQQTVSTLLEYLESLEARITANEKYTSSLDLP